MSLAYKINAAIRCGNADELEKLFSQDKFSPSLINGEALDTLLMTCLRNELFSYHFEQILTLCLKAGFPVNTRLGRDFTLLHRLCWLDSFRYLVPHLLTYSPQVNLQNSNGNTPLHLACQYPRVETVELLLKRGADVKIKNQQGLTPLDINFRELSESIVSGCDKDAVMCFKLLTRDNPELNIHTYDGIYPANEAALSLGLLEVF